MEVFVIIPSFNEEKNIGRVVRGLFENGFNNVIVVDDGSIDETVVQAKAAGAKVVLHQVNRGQGAALATGNEYVRALGGGIVVHFDGDNQFNPADIRGAIELMQQQNLDVVLGSRFLDQRSQIPWIKKHLILPVARWINFVFTGLKLTDAHNGFRVLSPNALNKIIITHDGMAHNTEIPAQIKKIGLKYAEYPVQVVYFEDGQGVKGGIKIIFDLVFGSMLK